MSKALLPRPAIIDTDQNFLETILGNRLAMEQSPFLASDLSTALYDLERNGKLVSGVFVNSNIGKRGIRAIAEAVLSFAPTALIYMVYEESLSVFFTKEDLASFHIRGIVNKPATYEQLISRLEVDLKGAQADAQLADIPKLVKAARADGYALLPRDNFKAGTVVDADVYVRTGPGQYQQILTAGEELSSAAVAEPIYIKLEEHQRVVVKTLALGLETAQFLKNSGITDESLVEANKFVAQVSNMVAQLHQGDAQGLGGLLARLSQSDHAVSITIIASLFLRPLVIHSDKGHAIVGLASLAHDIGLSDDAEALALMELSAMSEFDKKQYYQHPLTGSGLVGFMPGVDVEVGRAVEQHHERRNGTGFPNGLKGEAISPFAEIIGLSDMLSENIEKFKKGLIKENPFDRLEKNLEQEFSPTTILAYRKTFRRGA